MAYFGSGFDVHFVLDGIRKKNPVDWAYKC